MKDRKKGRNDMSVCSGEGRKEVRNDVSVCV